jgi:multicomponent K+:H+ antiporter subunit D
MGQVAVTGGALFYLVSSTFGLAAFFLLIELVERGRDPGADMIAITREIYGEEHELDTEEHGQAIPATLGMLGIAFIACALVLSGLPPLSGFIAKFALLAGALDLSPGGSSVKGYEWVFVAALISSGLATLIAMTRAGIRAFWAQPDRMTPRVRVIEMAPVALPLVCCAVQTVEAGPIMRFMHAAAQSLHAPDQYIRAVIRGAADNRVENKE